MRVLVVAVSAPSKMTGVCRHAISLSKCLLMQNAEVCLVLAPWQLEEIGDAILTAFTRYTLYVAEMKSDVLARNLWHCTMLPRLVQESGADIVHLTCPVPFLKSLIPRPVVATLHDLYPIEIRENFGCFKSIFNRAILHLYLRSADAITAVSDRTLELLQVYIPKVSCKAQRIYNCLDPLPPVASRSPLPEWRGYPFLLCVAQHRRNKNVILLLRAFHRLMIGGYLAEGTRLVVIGIAGPETDAIERMVRDLDLASRIVFLAGISDAELHWCYCNAKMLVAPSQTEGFGYPVVEALQAGCRIICSDIPVFREIATPLAHFFSLEGDAEQNLVNAILHASSSPTLQQACIERFTSSKIGEQYVALYSGLHLQHFSVPAGVARERLYENKF